MANFSPSPLPSGVRLVREFSGIKEYRLDNGLQILLNVNLTTPAPIGVDLVYRVGSAHENYGETGIAHVLEHMVFKQTSCDQCDALSELAKRSIAYNAVTKFDNTHYYARFTSDQVGLGHVSWYMGWLAGMLNQQNFIAAHQLDTERVVVRSEWEINTDNDEQALLSEVIASMFKWHNYGNAILGADSDVAQLNVAQLRAFYQRYYRPDNACLIVSGQIDPTWLFDSITTHFSPITRPNEPLPVFSTIEPLQQGEREITLRRFGAAPKLLLAYRGPASTHPDAAVLLLLMTIWQERIQQAFASDHSEFVTLTLVSTYMITCHLKLTHATSYEQSRRVLLQQFESALPITQAELDAARAAPGGSDDLGNIVSAWGDWRFAIWTAERMRTVSLSEVQGVADILFQPHHRTLGTLLPIAQKLSTWRAAPLVDLDALSMVAPNSTQPTTMPPFNISQVDLDAGTQRFTLNSRCQVKLYRQVNQLPVAAHLRLVFSDVGVINQYLLPYLLQQLLYSYQTSSAEVRLDVEVGGLMRVDIVLQAQQPSWLAQEIGKVCQQLARSISLTPNEWDLLLSNLRYRLVNHGAWIIADRGLISPYIDYPYSANHPLYHPGPSDFTTAVNMINLQSLYPSLQNMLASCQVQLGVWGDVDSAILQQQLNDGCRDWPAIQPYQSVLLSSQISMSARSNIKQMPGWQGAQTWISSYLSINATHADYPALKMANLLLSGAEFSRLWVSIREREGLSYALNSDFLLSPYLPSLVWYLMIGFTPREKARVEQCFNEELARARRDGFNEQELLSGKSYFANQRWYQAWKNQHTKESDPKRLAQTLALGVDINDDLQLYNGLAALSLNEVNEALRRYLDPVHMSRYVVGDF